MKKFIVVVVALVLIGWGLYFMQSGLPGRGIGRVDPVLAARAARDIPLAVAHLENHEAQEAIALLAALEKDLPKEKAILQNLVIGRYLAFVNAKETDDKEALKAAAVAEVQRLQVARPDDWHSYALGGLLMDQLDDAARAYSQYEAIAPIKTAANGGDARPASRIGDVTMLYAMAKAGLSLPEGPEHRDAAAALALASERDPENFWILHDLIQLQVETKDLQLGKTLERLAAISPVVEASIKKAVPYYSFPDSLQKARTLAGELASGAEDEDAKWKVLSRIARGEMCNVLKPEDAAQTDQKYLYRHPLDFVVSELPAAVAASVNPESSAVEVAPSIPLEWVPATLPDALRSLAPVKQARLADMTLDRKPELCVLSETSFSVWSCDSGGAWTVLVDVPVSGVDSFLLTDLDDDSVDIPVENDPSGVKQVGRADLDVVLYGEAGVQLWQNVSVGGQRSLTAWPAENSQVLDGKTREAEAADLDLDGDMDLILAGDFGVRIGFNTGKPLFFTRPDTPVLVPANASVSRIVPVDIDRDQDIDAVVVAGGQVYLLESLRHATLRWKVIEALAGVKDVTDVQVLEADGNASWDLLVTGGKGAHLALSHTPEAGKWLLTLEQVKSVDSNKVWLSHVADLDNDGAEDLIGFGFARPLTMQRGRFSKGFETASWKLPADLPSVLDLHAADFDKDGDLDLCLVDATGVKLLENKGGNANAWLDLEIVGKQVKSAQAVSSGRVNHYGVGSLLELRTSTGYQARVVGTDPPHIGLGPKGTADLARLIWPNGFPANVFQPKPNQTLWEVQTLLGSCPYLYLWDGECYQFATDLLWSAPLGMPSPAGGMTPSREWEYLKLPGSLLKERDGVYSLQLTEELNEAAYFDQVQLIAVDHPSDVAVYSNEKVGPPSIAAKKIHTVRQPRTPLSATDQLGRDLLPAISQLDEVYTQHWNHKIKQGWTEKTSMELDLGEVSEKARVTLLMTGWVYPTDPAISVSIQQDPARAGFGIQPPSLEVPDGQGGWKSASPYIGFPGGKTKTIAIDLTGQLAPNDGRVRIVTSMELCWDQVFYTVDEASAEVIETPLELVSAELHFRGCSARVIHPQHGPERYDYSHVDPMIYSSMGGKFTRYGDVKELLTSQDDRMVILGCGDECTLTFTAPPAPPAGWTRDFLIHNVGWDKDCNPQNTYAKTVEPLPYSGMQSYPPAEPFPDDEFHRSYLEKYQTREQSDVQFRRFVFLRGRP